MVKTFTESDKEVIIKMKSDGYSIDTIACFLHVGKRRVRIMLTELGISAKQEKTHSNPRGRTIDLVQQINSVIPEMPNAACRGCDTELFYPPSLYKNSYQERVFEPQKKRAIEICNTCPHQEECLDYAVAAEPMGIWGGTTDIQRVYLRFKTGATCEREMRIAVGGDDGRKGIRTKSVAERLDAELMDLPVVQSYLRKHNKNPNRVN